MGSGFPTLVAGSYERFLFGFSHPASFNNKQSFELKTQFTVRGRGRGRGPVSVGVSSQCEL